MQVITTIDANSQLIEVSLDRQVFFVTLDWNDEAELWVIGLQDAERNTLISGIALSANWPLFWRFRYPYMPRGDLMALTDTYLDGGIRRDSFVNGEAALCYVTEDELREQGLLDVYGQL